jgi:DNA modification methylase
VLAIRGRRMGTLYYGDNLTILREHVKNESVDLVYLDPPFNSNANYNVLFRAPDGHQSHAQMEAFEDTWHWNETAEKAFDEVMQSGNSDAAEMLRAMRSFLKENDMMAYLAMMAVRLIELNRVLKETGSLYLHCDPTASHYLKILLDAVFGPKFFRNEIIWKRSSSHADTKQGMRRAGRIHDVILFYTNRDEYTWNPVFTPYDDSYLDGSYKFTDENGRRYREGDLTAAKPGGDVSYEWRVKRQTGSDDRWMADLNNEHLLPKPDWDYLGVKPYNRRFWAYSKENMAKMWNAGQIVHRSTGFPQFKRFLDEQPGVPLQDIWADINPLIGGEGERERLGYPTQKPVALLERILNASSNEGDVVLDPFCGCGTTVHAAQKLNREWIGIDVTHLAISLIQKRLRDAFPLVKIDVHGVPKDLDGARALAAQDKYQFQWWAVSLVDAVPFGNKKKGADGGIDGLIYFKPDNKTTEKAIVSVKGGENVGVGMIKDLIATVEREKAKMGLMITLAEPTSVMRKEAVTSGYYRTEAQGDFAKIQILTIEELMNGKQPHMPWVDPLTFKKAKREMKGDQQKLL